jgi:ABC-2 type transport system ATP-binding protein
MTEAAPPSPRTPGLGPGGAPSVVVRDLRKSYGAVEAVRGLSFEVAPGECFGLLGPNGAGKTTTIEILEGLLAPTAGEVVVLGRRWGRDDQAIRERMGVCLQQTVLSEKLHVRETVELFRSFHRRGRAPEAVIRQVELTEKERARVGTLSGGQKQRLAVACALVGDPELLFLDEPTTGLDPQSRRQVWDIVNEFKAGGRTVLLTTHYMDEAERLCDRVAIVDHGRVIAEGSPLHLMMSLGGEHVVEISVREDAKGTLPASAMEGLPAVRSAHAEAGRIVLTVTEPHVAIPAVLERLRVGEWALSGLSTRHASLEDVFVALTGRHLRDE